MKMHILSGGRLRMKKKVYHAQAQSDEMIDLPVSCYLLKHPQGNVLFDTGCHPIIQSDAQSRWGTMAKAMIPIGNPEENVIDDLAKLQMTPLDIDVVVNSHFHTDHCGCNAFFKKATIICHAKELENAQAENAAMMGFLRMDWDHPMPIETIDRDRDLFGDGKIILIPMPGHTPGMTTALVNLEQDGSFLLASDAVALKHNLDTKSNPRNTWDQAASLQSFDEIEKIIHSGSTIIYGHDIEQWQSLRKGILSYGK
jgi:glyoxylase-like metal-dependent hydrolase (beta-lactamase superfamily II)